MSRLVLYVTMSVKYLRSVTSSQQRNGLYTVHIYTANKINTNSMCHVGRLADTFNTYRLHFTVRVYGKKTMQ